MSIQRPFSHRSEDPENPGADDFAPTPEERSEKRSEEPPGSPFDDPDLQDDLSLEDSVDPESIRRIPRHPLSQTGEQASGDFSIQSASGRPPAPSRRTTGSSAEDEISDRHEVLEDAFEEEVLEKALDEEVLEEADEEVLEEALNEEEGEEALQGLPDTGREVEALASPPARVLSKEDLQAEDGDAGGEFPTGESQTSSKRMENPDLMDPGEPAKIHVAKKGATSATFSRFQRLSTLEKACLITIFLVCAAGGIAFLSNIFAKAIEESEGVEAAVDPEFPREGKLVTIADVTTYWVQPGERLVAPTEPKYVPEIVVTLSGGAGKGSLRIEFLDDRGDHVGDSEFLEFTNGNFDGSKNPKVAKVHGTDGPGWDAFITAYRTSSTIEKPWSVKLFEVVEGQETDSNALLLWQTISTKLLEE